MVIFWRGSPTGVTLTMSSSAPPPWRIEPVHILDAAWTIVDPEVAIRRWLLNDTPRRSRTPVLHQRRNSSVPQNPLPNHIQDLRSLRVPECGVRHVRVDFEAFVRRRGKLIESDALPVA